jgi:hypothetical protein
MSGDENMQILCFIKKKKLLKNGEAPIFIRITLNQERSEFGLKKSVLPKHWNAKLKRVKSSSPDAD